MNAMLLLAALTVGMDVHEIGLSDDSLVPSFTSLVGDVKVQPVQQSDQVPLPFLTWGGDVPTFHANGGLTTKPESIFGGMGLKFKLTNGDDFIQQTRDYLGGKTPYLRGTYTMVGQAAQLLNQDASTKPVMVFQLTWSAGDHMVARESVKNLTDLRGKKICLQQGGPHPALVNDALMAANLKWSDVKVVWAKDLSGPNGPADMFRKDASIDAVCVISPDMAGLCSGIDQKGSGAEGTVKGSHVLVSTAQMSRCIADVYCVRADYFRDHRDLVEKFVAGYLKGCDELIRSKKEYNDGKGKSPAYLADLKLAQSILGDKVLPNIETDAHGLVSDATFVGLPGNVSFFNDAGNLSGFSAMQKKTLDLVTTLGYSNERMGFKPAGWDWQKIAKLAGVEYSAAQTTAKIKAEDISVFPDSNLDDRTLLAFDIHFEPNQEEFSADTYGSEFKRVIQEASTFGHCAVVIRGHADPTRTLVDFLQSGMKRGIVQRTGNAQDGYKYTMNGNPLDLTATEDVIKAIRDGQFSGSDPNPQETMQVALTLSQNRAEAVKKAIAEFAKSNKMNLNLSQVQPSGVGIREPLVAKPKNPDESRKNMRVEFRLIKVKPEAITSADYDY